MNNPRVTIILSSLNHGGFVGEAIQSILDQSYADCELFIIDDCSQDNSWEIIQGFHDPRITAIRNPVRMRGAYGFNEIINHRARGEFIAIHHSDDVWQPDKLEKQVSFLDKHQDVGAVFTRVQVIDEKGAPFSEENHYYYRVFEQPNRSRYEWLYHFFFHGNALCHPSVLVRRECYLDVGAYDRRLGQIADFEMWIRLCLKYSIHIIDERLTRFRVFANALNQSGDKPESHIRCYVEYQLALRNYLAIATEEDLYLIFPDICEMGVSNHNNIPFLVARYAIDRGKFYHKIFGINVLYEMMGNTALTDELERVYGFSYQDLIKISGKDDIFQILLVRKLYANINKSHKEIDRIHSTVSWRLTKPLRGIAMLMRGEGGLILQALREKLKK